MNSWMYKDPDTGHVYINYTVLPDGAKVGDDERIGLCYCGKTGCYRNGRWIHSGVYKSKAMFEILSSCNELRLRER